MSSGISKRLDPSRRSTLKIVGAAVGGLVVGLRLPLAATRGAGGRSEGAQGSPSTFEANAFVRVGSEGSITLTIPSVEMGQGIYTGMATLLAEELEVELDQVRIEPAPADTARYANPLLQFQATGGSTSVRAWWQPLRLAGASARMRLVAAAAQTWRVDVAQCISEKGTVVHVPTRRRLGYGALVKVASALPEPKDVPLKTPTTYRLIGKSLKRLDAPAKVNGTAQFSIDIILPAMKVATLAACPVFGGKVERVDDRRATAVPGVRQVVVLTDLVAVVADHMWAAKLGLAALDITWDHGPHAKLTSDVIERDLATGSKEGTPLVALNIGNTDSASGKNVEATYMVPFLAHAALEPMSYTVHVRPDGCEIWGATQVMARAQATAAKLTGLPLDKVLIHNQLLGGAFGRRLETDGVEKAVRIAMKVNHPVKVIWTREEDIQQERYRPCYHDKLVARLGDNGLPTAFHHRVTGSSVSARFAPVTLRADGLDPDAVDGSVDAPYGIPNRKVEFVRREPPAVTTAFWRGVGPGHNVFVIESFIDELAYEAGQDPVSYRRALLGGQPRLRAVLDLAAKRADWGKKLSPGWGRGVALQTTFDTFMAQIAEVEVDVLGIVHVRRVTCVIDCGTVINPDTVIAQAQGGIVFGLTAALFGEITIDKGRVKQSNFHDYRMLRINETPSIDVHLVPSSAAPGGIGEAGTVGAPPSLANAVFAATGTRVRRLPIARTPLKGRSA